MINLVARMAWRALGTGTVTYTATVQQQPACNHHHKSIWISFHHSLLVLVDQTTVDSLKKRLHGVTPA
jgi:hypothetical protein